MRLRTVQRSIASVYRYLVGTNFFYTQRLTTKSNEISILVDCQLLLCMNTALVRELSHDLKLLRTICPKGKKTMVVSSRV